MIEAVVGDLERHVEQCRVLGLLIEPGQRFDEDAAGLHEGVFPLVVVVPIEPARLGIVNVAGRHDAYVALGRGGIVLPEKSPLGRVRAQFVIAARELDEAVLESVVVAVVSPEEEPVLVDADGEKVLDVPVGRFGVLGLAQDFAQSAGGQ